MTTPAERRELTEEEIARAFAEPENAPPVGSEAPETGLPRWIDPLLAGTVLVLLSPILLVIAILIRLDSRGPVLFKQIRVGRYESTFQLYKLRTTLRRFGTSSIEKRRSQWPTRVTRGSSRSTTVPTPTGSEPSLIVRSL